MGAATFRNFLAVLNSHSIYGSNDHSLYLLSPLARSSSSQSQVTSRSQLQGWFSSRLVDLPWYHQIVMVIKCRIGPQREYNGKSDLTSKAMTSCASFNQSMNLLDEPPEPRSFYKLTFIISTWFTTQLQTTSRFFPSPLTAVIVPHSGLPFREFPASIITLHGPSIWAMIQPRTITAPNVYSPLAKLLFFFTHGHLLPR